MTERTVTEKQVRDALAFSKAQPIANDIAILNRLFPELPKVGELILVWDNNQQRHGEWLPFIEIDCGVIMVTDHDGDKESWDNYRRQTPAERGEG